MPEQLQDPVLVAFYIGTMLLSAATCLVLWALRAQGPLLRFEPRALVPWNAAGAVLSCIFVALTIGTAVDAFLTSQDADEVAVAEAANDMPNQSDKPSKDLANSAHQLLLTMAPEIVIVGGTLLLVAVYFKATPADLGLPASRQEFASDVVIGIIAGYAAVAPIHLIHGLLMWSFRRAESQHPLVEMVQDAQPGIGIMLLASIAAVLIAPICEEITFRLLLQGWLEKWETVQVIDARDDHFSAAEPSPSGAEASARPALDLSTAPNESGQLALGAPPSLGCASLVDTPPATGIGGLPFGSLPIVISSLLFGLAHFGYGPEPVPLFFLALVLGYLYQRTHRIVPCIVAHAVFNSFTIVLLWRMIFHSR